ncbi:uncharacterized protein LOC118740912 [Rhagoletis pomonella]|uniref:uncharacterized protein LOC118740912 n=1 Tax=Rhagoletis pomonella TaxID=28610 RepID=UPI00177ABA02|nr:uncharacterized protein LOC118740912 [Rhagoletis pomonella]
MFQRVSVEMNSTDVSEQSEDLEVLNIDGLENLAGYICHKLGKDNPEICMNPETDSSYTWVNHVSEGGLSKPTDMLMEHMKALLAVFDEVNGSELYICKDYLKKHLDLSSHVNCSQKVKELFFRARMYFRIRSLNKSIVENQYSKKRKLNKTVT